MRGCTSLRLEVREDNVRAINLYERMTYSRFAVTRATMRTAPPRCDSQSR